MALVKSKIYTIRGQKVMLDFDLAQMYEVETKALNQAVKRNIKRFDGDDFMFRLTKDEATKIVLRSQIVTAKLPLESGNVSWGRCIMGTVLLIYRKNRPLYTFI